MRKRCALVASQDRRLRKILKQLVRASCYEAQAAKDHAQLASCLSDDPNERFDLIVLDSTFLEDGEATQTFELINRLDISRSRRTRTLVINEGDLTALIPRLFREFGVTNLIAKNAALDMHEVLVTMNKVIQRKMFGIEKYLPWGLRVVTRTIHTSDRKVDILDEMREWVTTVGCGKRFAETLITVADELITNAIYNAPVYPDGTPMFRDQDRADTVVLPPGGEVTLKYASDGRRLGLSVSDCFGTLKESTIINYLERCFRKGDDQIEEKLGGAGLGLYLAFGMLNSFIVNIDSGEQSELIGFIDVAGSFAESQKKEKSFHIFTNPG